MFSIPKIAFIALDRSDSVSYYQNRRNTTTGGRIEEI